MAKRSEIAEIHDNPEVSFALAKEIILGMSPKRFTMLLGQPGVGKSALGREIAEAENAEFWAMAGPAAQEFDFIGLPALDGPVTRFKPLELIYRASDRCKEYTGPMVILLDDYTVAREEVQSVLYMPVNERRMNEWKLRDNIRWLLTGNRVSDKSGAHDLNLALGNRGLILHLGVRVQEWLDWAVRNRVHPSVVGFIRTHENMLNTFDPKTGEFSQATPRSWTLLSDIIQDFKGDTRHLFVVAAGVVGKGAATMLVGWMKYFEKLTPPDEIVKDPEHAHVPSEEDMDVLHATVASLEHHITENTKHWKAALIYAKRIMPELAVLLVRCVCKVVIERIPDSVARGKILSDPIFKEISEKYGAILS